MKSIVIAFIIGVVSGYYVAGMSASEIASPSPEAEDTDQSVQEETQEVEQVSDTDEMKTVIDEAHGISFIYRKNPDGYVMSAITEPVGTAHFLKGYRLVLAEDVASQVADSEGPPSIDIRIFKNPDLLAPRVWASTHGQLSNIEFATGAVADIVFKDAPGIRYMSDGLYTTDTILVSMQKRLYLISGSFGDIDSLIRDDFLDVIDAVEFMPVK
jgi:hypothetical protein